MAPRADLLTEKGRELLGDLPAFLREDPDVKAVYHAHAREADRMNATLDRLRANLNPLTADELGMPWHEALLGLAVEPEGQTLEERRSLVLAYYAGASEGGGLDWIIAVTRIAGAGWTYREHVPGSDRPPPAYTVNVELPFFPDSYSFAAAEALLRAVTPANLDLVVTSQEGFQLDASRLDEEAL